MADAGSTAQVFTTCSQSLTHTHYTWGWAEVGEERVSTEHTHTSTSKCCCTELGSTVVYAAVRLLLHYTLIEMVEADCGCCDLWLVGVFYLIFIPEREHIKQP